MLATELKVDKLGPLIFGAVHVNLVVVGVDDRIELFSIKEVALHYELQINVLIVFDKSDFATA